MCWRAELPFRGTWTGWIKWSASGGVRKENANPCPGWDNPTQQHRVRVSGQEVASEKTWRTWWVERLKQVQRRITKLARGLVNTAYGDCSGSWVCPAWRQEGSGETLPLPAAPWRESEKSNQTLCRSSQWSTSSSDVMPLTFQWCIIGFLLYLRW